MTMDISRIVKQMSREEKIRLCTGKNNWQTQSYAALGVPELMMSDGTNGVRFQKNSTDEAQDDNVYDAMLHFSFDNEQALAATIPATCFPSGSALAASWDTQLASEVGAAVAEECKAIGIGLLLGPGMNIRRHPLTARNFEYYSEDPVLSGEMAAGMVNGVQGAGVGATVKHFACNNSDTRRTHLSLQIEERALREIYLAGFERVIQKAKPAAIMGAYPAVNGEQACESRWLLQDVLRRDWGYEGVALSDWGAVKDSVKAMQNGLDFQMPNSRQFIDTVTAALADGTLAESVLDTHCARILAMVLRYTRAGKPAPVIDWKKQHATAQKAAAACAVLLKNENSLLPLNAEKTSRVAVLGAIAQKPLYQGTGCAVVRAKEVDIPFACLQRRAPGTSFTYAAGYRDDYTTTDALLREAAETAAAAEVALVLVGTRLPGETDDYDRKDAALEAGHSALIEAVCAAQTNTVVLVYNGDAITMPWAEKVPAILDMWYGGEGVGQATAALVFGDENPSGKLPVTMPRALCDTPAYLDFPHEQDTGRYREGIFVGYRYYDARQMEPLFPFGHGLSYTHFSCDAIETAPTADGGYQVRVRIANTGARAGAEVVQLYVAGRSRRVFRPEKELKAFAKLHLQPGESAVAEFLLTRRDFAYYDDVLGDWFVEGGAYTLLCGQSSRRLPLRAAVQITGDALPVRKLAPDSHYSDLFAQPAAAKVYFDFLVAHGLLRPEQLVPALETELAKTFWGIAQHLDMLTHGALGPADIESLVEAMNEAIGAA